VQEGGDAAAASAEEEDEEEMEATLAVECVGFSAKDLRWVASGGMDNALKVWDLTTGSCRSICHHGGSVVALKWHASQPVICTASLDSVVRVWDARAGNLLQELTGHAEIITSLEMRCGVLPADPTITNAESFQGPVDLIISVSDDFTARLFTIDLTALLNRPDNRL